MLIVYVVAWKTEDGWEWEVYSDYKLAFDARNDREDAFGAARLIEFDAFDTIADELERVAPWYWPEV